MSAYNDGTDQRIAVVASAQISVFKFNGTNFALESSRSSTFVESDSVKMFGIGSDVIIASCHFAFPYTLYIHKINGASLDLIQNNDFSLCHDLDFGSFGGNNFLFAANDHIASPDLGIYLWNGTQFVYCKSLLEILTAVLLPLLEMLVMTTPFQQMES